LDTFNKIAIGCAVIFGVASLLIAALAATQPATEGAFTPLGNLITQNTIQYGNSTTYMMQWNGSTTILSATAGGTLIYSAKVVNGTQITLVVPDGETASVYADNSFVTKITP
jgi:hypothetical protein